jgi:hypothetical protein
VPVIATEFGSTDGKGDFDAAFTAYAARKKISWTAWAWFAGGDAFPSLLEKDGSPTRAGAVVRDALAASSLVCVPGESAAPPGPSLGFTDALAALGR